MTTLRGKYVAWAGASFLVCMLSACAAAPYTPPPPLAAESLAGALAQVFQLAGSSNSGAPTTTASVCSTEAGYCPVPAGTLAGLRCTCDAPDASYTYAGRTGDIPPMPTWADPSKARR